MKDATYAASSTTQIVSVISCAERAAVLRSAHFIKTRDDPTAALASLAARGAELAARSDDATAAADKAGADAEAAETALAILSEIVAARHGASGGSLVRK